MLNNCFFFSMKMGHADKKRKNQLLRVKTILSHIEFKAKPCDLKAYVIEITVAYLKQKRRHKDAL